MKGLTIGQVAKLAGVGVETIRFYEREGLLAQPDRKESGYRQFDDEAVPRLRFIRRAKELGFSLKEIRELIDLQADPEASRANVKHCAETKLAGIEARIRDLLRMKDALKKLVDACPGEGPLIDCPILDALNFDSTPSTEVEP
jgi:MerR family transcriptional regulator, copper efflux regulator